jgi:hypothetical protein
MQILPDESQAGRLQMQIVAAESAAGIAKMQTALAIGASFPPHHFLRRHRPFTL